MSKPSVVPSPDDKSKPADQAEGNIKRPDEDQLDPEYFRVDQSELDQPVTKTAITAISVRRPKPLEWIRTHPDPDRRISPVYFVDLKENREYYLIDPKLRRELRPREYWIGQVFLATTRLDKPFLWLVKLQSPTGKVSDWYLTELDCAERAMHEWIQLAADASAGVYTAVQAEELLEDPLWPEQSFKELFHLGFKRRWIADMEHKVFKQIRGRRL
jgi:hypothetical protein